MQNVSRWTLAFGLGLALGPSVPGQESGSASTAQPAIRSSLSELPRPLREEIDRLASDDAGKRATAAVSLGEMGAQATPAIPYLIGALSDGRSVVGPFGTSTVDELAVKALAQIGEPARQALLDALKTKSARDLGSVMMALGKLQETRAVELILPYLDGPEAVWAVAALGDMGDRRAVPPLLEMLPAKDGPMGVVEALGKLGDLRAVEPLMQLLREDGDQEHTSASKALFKLTGQRFKNRKEAAAWWQQNKDRLKGN
jgi:HEAT repeat protein